MKGLAYPALALGMIACSQLAGLGDFADAETSVEAGGGGVGGDGGMVTSTGGQPNGGSGATGGMGGSGGMPSTGGNGGVGGVGGVGGAPCLGDTDMDGVCDDEDICPGIQDNGDGTCTAFFDANPSDTRSRQMRRYDSDPNDPTCPLTLATSIFGANDVDTGTNWDTQLRESNIGAFDRFNIKNIYLTFDTGVLDDGVTVNDVLLFIDHTSDSTSSNVQVYGGVQPVFGNTVTGDDFFKADALQDSIPANTIAAAGTAQFDIATGQLNLTGATQLMITLDTPCNWPNGNQFTNQFVIRSPNADEGERPQLRVNYTP